ncbi:MAG: LTA synthase family protein, partial [Candidatus Staskawiczbacteria bacterium]|nr:LTA synthase family protein [Candidatus Staskawiczbacteria bacterium]
NNYFAQAGPGNTADAEFSTMNSLYSLPDDVVFVNYAKNQYKALPQLLKKNGYGTYCFHGDVATFWNRSNVYPGLGYDKMYDLTDFTVTRPVGKGPSDLGDEDLFSQTLQKMQNLKQPLMATTITMSSHTPFILPDDLQTLKLPEKTGLNWLQWEYLESVHYTDKAIGEFIDGLKKSGLYDNSIIFIWGDHGSFTGISSALGENRGVLANLAGDRVPLIVLNSGLTGINSTPGSHLDVYPTITNLFGIETPETVLGQDLLNSSSPVVTHAKLVSGKIDGILAQNLAYTAGKDGIFDDGECFQMPEETNLPISDCQNLYQQQADTVRASNIIVRGDLLKLFADNLTQKNEGVNVRVDNK